MTIRRIEPASLAKVLGILYVIFGILVGAFLTLLSLGGLGPGNWGPPTAPSGGPLGLIFGVAAIVVLPICYGVIGWIGGWLVGAIYNGIAGRFGGIVLQTE